MLRVVGTSEKNDVNKNTLEFLTYLRSEGYQPEQAGENEIIFKIEGRTYVVAFGSEDDQYYQMLFPNFWEIENDEDWARAARAALHATARTKVAKVFLNENQVWASVELFLPDVTSFKSLFARNVSVLKTAVNEFAAELRNQAQ